MKMTLDVDLDRLVGFDQDQNWFLRVFKEEPVKTIVEIGDYESMVGYILSMRGHDYYGVDLRGQLESYNDTINRAFGLTCPGHYRHIQGDFLQMDKQSDKQFDVAIALSTIEHMGLQTYNDPVNDPLYDAKAIAKIYDWLKPGGVFYVTVPYGKIALTGRLDGYYKEHPKNVWEWRVFNAKALRERIIQNFFVDSIDYFIAASHTQTVDGVTTSFKPGQILTKEEADTIVDLPNCSVGLRMIKKA